MSFLRDLIGDIIWFCLLGPFYLFGQGFAGAVRPTRDARLVRLQKVTGLFLILGCAAFLGGLLLIAWLGDWANGPPIFFGSLIPLAVASALGARIERALDAAGKKDERR